MNGTHIVRGVSPDPGNPPQAKEWGNVRKHIHKLQQQKNRSYDTLAMFVRGKKISICFNALSNNPIIMHVHNNKEQQSPVLQYDVSPYENHHKFFIKVTRVTHPYQKFWPNPAHLISTLLME